MKTIASPATTRLETERLILRPVNTADIPAIVTHAGDPRIAFKTTLIPHPYHLGHALDWLESVMVDRKQGNEVFAIERRDEPEAGMIGIVSLELRSDKCSADVGYWLGVPYWRKGYATEALREVLRHGFEDRSLLYVGACHMADNQASGRVMQKANMKFEHVIRGGLVRFGTAYDRVNYGIFADEWRFAGG
ncbi:GNAT family N-acetyltransferase [Haloferula sp. BvORR071]|uniref:GNAT family N-acetyltransferase n=1 Tax=Haloferula sp. BvORR071 TaxID=1396141 RepID=UPI00054F5B9C|nr:GNAT family N-acetyltransferase [Haloferula sp. BvORR071]